MDIKGRPREIGKKDISRDRHPENSRNPQPKSGSRSVYPGEIGKESHGAGPVRCLPREKRSFLMGA